MLFVTLKDAGCQIHMGGPPVDFYDLHKTGGYILICHYKLVDDVDLNNNHYVVGPGLLQFSNS